eukprot:CAMPEP_0198724192 /NCGR_PEP_ID=MMETSP1475-20131203/1685_1 /TAXON_ID= ORGANISM="Unidentified sp., Strain CCMP1999" /NCGR_SAMPLE_ID=MMETSP1475 /ASSEMBLY_ACC=CAM_ASM_001111 /LENGTH=118 /DNA_ID=CAMNT_0044485637 /DNA_START=45 /DNA_END=401 /DNA_ORIENTATION=+
MKYLGAYMLATMGGKSDPSAADLKSILDAVGIEGDESVMEKICSELSGKDVQEVIEAGKEKFSKVAAVGAVAAAPAAGGAAPAAGGGGGGGDAAAAPEEEKKEEEEEEDEDMGFSLFD